ncbi:MAG: sugar transferase [Oscillospiraceae bacterium]|nr:sugar transferase [Oscillospiraceae bacterium]
MLINWADLPKNMQTKEILYYYQILQKKKKSLVIKRIFDIICSGVLILILCPAFVILALAIKMDSKGKVIFKQKRVTKYGKTFNIYKFRSMIHNAEKFGTQVTKKNDSRITKVGKTIRKFRLDELPQLLNIFIGDLSFVGVRPEVPKYAEKYTSEMMATLLLPAGVTSAASIAFKNEEEILNKFDDTEKAYINLVLPQKMKINLQYIKDFNFFYDLKIMFMTLAAVAKR